MTNSNTSVVCPVYYQVIQRRGNGWAFKHGEPFINLFNAPDLSPEEDQLETYLARIKADYGWLCIFDRSSNAPAFTDRLQTKNATTKKGDVT
ncbi:MAG: hypothetical protein KME64_24150 [Scytonematopsis contorta HA4267-MV1]|nr:hypothetical protein [Scytonematopsis contorta HA4267-MV1]